MTHYQLVAKNKARSVAVMVGFVLFVLVTSYVIARAFDYPLSMVGTAFIVAGMSTFFSYFFSDRIVLTISGAKPANRQEHFDFYTITENIVNSQRLPMPKLYVIEDSAMNAFATGRNPSHAVVCATTGLLARLNRSELEGVIAHEISHIKNYDILLMSIVSVLVGLIALLGDWVMRGSVYGPMRNNNKKDGERSQLDIIMFFVAIVMALLAPIISKLIKLALSRRYEFLADANAAAITKNPEGLAKALIKISQDQEPLEAANKATAHLYISDPLKNSRGGVAAFKNLFQTHPPVAERVQALRAISIK